MIYPKFIKSESTIGVPAPSNGSFEELDIARYKNAKKNVEKLGYNVQLSNNVFESEKCRSADKKVRAQELNEMFKNDEIDFIWCATGGEFRGRSVAGRTRTHAFAIAECAVPEDPEDEAEAPARPRTAHHR